jgi:hypothetical protein
MKPIRSDCPVQQLPLLLQSSLLLATKLLQFCNTAVAVNGIADDSFATASDALLLLSLQISAPAGAHGVGAAGAAAAAAAAAAFAAVHQKENIAIQIAIA